MDNNLLSLILEQAFPRATVTILPPLLGSENRHGVVRIQNGPQLFIKFYASQERFRNEGLTLEALARTSSWAILPQGAGEEQGICWRAFPYKELHPVILDRTLAHAWGQLLGEIHSTPAPQDLKTSSRAIDLVTPRLQVLQAFPTIGERTSHLWASVCSSVTSESAFDEYYPVLLSNDFGVRNTFFLDEAGRMILLDFERSAIGDAYWDLGKCWDNELLDQDLRVCFLEGYREVRQLSADTWPSPATLWITRFVAALAIFPYAQRVNDTPFFEHGLEKLALLEREAERWK